MKKLFAAAALALALAAPSLATAQAPFAGFRIGYGFPNGNVVAGTSQRDVIKSVVPLQLDLGWRLGPVDFGGYLSYGFASPASACPGSCSANVMRLGVEGMLRAPLARER